MEIELRGLSNNIKCRAWKKPRTVLDPRASISAAKMKNSGGTT